MLNAGICCGEGFGELFLEFLSVVVGRLPCGLAIDLFEGPCIRSANVLVAYKRRRGPELRFRPFSGSIILLFLPWSVPHVLLCLPWVAPSISNSPSEFAGSLRAGRASAVRCTA